MQKELIRIVRLSFREDKVGDFLANFETIKQQIRNSPGNRLLELYRDVDHPSVFFTYSYWDGPESLEAYRKSALFNEVWTYTKSLFAEKPMAWSTERLVRLD